MVTLPGVRSTVTLPPLPPPPPLPPSATPTNALIEVAEPPLPPPPPTAWAKMPSESLPLVWMKPESLTTTLPEPPFSASLALPPLPAVPPITRNTPPELPPSPPPPPIDCTSIAADMLPCVET